MEKNLINQINIIIDVYDSVCEMLETAFNELKKYSEFHRENESKLKEFNFDYVMKSNELENEEKKLKNIIEEECGKRNIEPKIMNLVQFYTVKGKEDVLNGLLTIMKKYQEYQIKSLTYQRMAQSKMTTSEAVIDFMVNDAREKGITERIFINRKL